MHMLSDFDSPLFKVFKCCIVTLFFFVLCVANYLTGLIPMQWLPGQAVRSERGWSQICIFDRRAAANNAGKGTNQNYQLTSEKA